MKARILRINPDEDPLPGLPWLLIENQGSVVATHLGRTLFVCRGALEAATPEEIAQALELSPEDHVFLSEARSLPDGDLLSEAMLTQVQNGGAEVALDARRLVRIPLAA